MGCGTWHRGMAGQRFILLLRARSTDGFDVQAQIKRRILTACGSMRPMDDADRRPLSGCTDER
jgi:hypothetical protein